VEPVTVGTDEPTKLSIPMLVQPNPADDVLYVSLGQAINGQVETSIVAADGRTVLTQSSKGLGLGQVITLHVQNLPAGVYSVRMQSAEGNSVQKVVIK
jgi:hypothetical protein